MSADIHLPLPWQDKVWQQLQRNIAHGTVPHALLFSGIAGVGKLTFARALCQRLLCAQPVNQVACGQCKSCLLVRAGNHPDLQVVSLEEKSQAIKIDQIRALVNGLVKTPQIGAWHCVVLHPADCLNINAANALLKLLEEPPGDAVLILISAHPQRLPATIRSRCRKISLDIPPLDVATTWLQDQGVQAEASAQVLAAAHGAPLRALALFRGQGLAEQEALAKLLAGVLSRHTAASDAASHLGNCDEREVIDYMLDVLAFAAGCSGDSVYLGSGLRAQLESVVDPLPVFQFYDKLLTIKRQLLSTANPNKQLLWEECLLDWQALLKQASRPTSGAINDAN